MKTTNLIEQVLREHNAARSSDRILQLRVWHELGLILTPEQRAKFMEMPSSETIRRVRQKLQEDGKYLAAEPVRKTRYHKSLVMQQNAPTATPERIEAIQEKLL